MESRRGFYEGGSKCPLSFSQSSSSSPSSRQNAPLLPFSYNHHHQQQRPAWIDNSFEDNIQESLSHQQTELTMAGGDNDGNDLEDHQLSVIHGVGGGGGGESSGGTIEVIEREHMFDKVVTPSDVGKLNRLVIPKQQAEKYFPLDSTTNEKGLLLNFEDSNGKPWRFRYSYWKSSQSYVMTKGWSRFVKEKKLDAGDVVSFQRGVGDSAKDRLFIDWRRRRPEPPNHPHELPPPIPAFSLSSHFSLRPWNHHHHHLLHHHQHQYQHHPHLMQPNYPVISPHQSHHFNSYNSPYNSYGNANLYGPGASSVVYLRSSGSISGGGGGVGGPQEEVGMMPIPPPMVYESVPVVQRKAAPKKLRLFGVNMECPITENKEREILSSTTLPHFSTITPSNSHRPNPPLSSRPYFLHQTNPQRFFQQNPNDDKGKSSMSLDLDI